ncbi:cytochrome c oxidase accessory protein CcoG [Prosthecomicrobium hirschii]|uniref:cytochrome c oxidase accessory protein CcoG n=1 Tax=Prosthecodimorpha hirschii TaxID=665126 RepID=UPI00221F5A7C|nr:cytochrome c oxidase accessory protein CcoG [Prosthecomicrobium hirschii]MCW1843141.1 cytochrome c oxidase accessory protein CcoG [Prosthecomicrobium hirschii]
MKAETVAGGGAVHEDSLYAEHKKIYPAAVQGVFRRIKWGLLIACLGVYYLLPFVRWNRGPDAPSQAVLIDFPNRRFYFFFIEIWPQEVYYITGLLILAALTLFLMNAVAGRVWCGYLCPQTVWTDLFLAVERLVEGDRRDRIKLDQAPWSAVKFGRKVLKHALWLGIAWWTGGAWVLYFSDAPTLVRDLLFFDAPLVAYIWIGILTFTTYILAGFAREQVCIYMCPWPRIQAALTDEWALNVSYRVDRGEPRTSVKAAERLRAAGQDAGDCIDCQQCVVVCPTGTDIRLGPQLSCIQCGLCIDACNNIMDKINRPHGLIAYDTDINIDRREHGKPEIYKFVRPRTILYVAVISIVIGIMTFVFTTRATLGVNVLHDRSPVYVVNSDGSIRNGYTVRILNKHREARDFVLSVTGVPERTRIEAVGATRKQDGNPIIEVGPDQSQEVRVNLIAPRDAKVETTAPIQVVVTETKAGERAAAKDFFKGP